MLCTNWRSPVEFLFVNGAFVVFAGIASVNSHAVTSRATTDFLGRSIRQGGEPINIIADELQRASAALQGLSFPSDDGVADPVFPAVSSHADEDFSRQISHDLSESLDASLDEVKGLDDFAKDLQLDTSAGILNTDDLLDAKDFLPEVDNRLAQWVQKAYYINLDDAAERKDFIETRLMGLKNIAQLPYQRFAATGRSDESVSAAFDKMNTTRGSMAAEKSWERTTGTLGCYFSHLRLWMQIWDDFCKEGKTAGPPFALVLEDDAQINATKMLGLPRKLQLAPAKADIIKLGGWGRVRSEDDAGYGFHRAVGPSKEDTWKQYYMGSHAYLINIRRLPVLIAHYKQLGYNHHWFTDANLWFDEDNCRSYQLHPDLVGTCSSLPGSRG